MPYENIIFVQHSVYTGCLQPDSITDLSTGRVFPNYDTRNLTYFVPPYHGLEDQEEDIKERVAYLNEIMNKAKEKILCGTTGILASDLDKTLVVFVTPEFYFRPKRGAYALDNVKKLKDELQKLVKYYCYENWLFVFGSIIGENEDPLTRSRTIENEVYILGVLPDGTGMGREVEVIKEHRKRHVSTIDYVQNEGRVEGSGYGISIPLITLANVAPISNKAEPGIFSFGNIEFGIEICLDHRKGVLRNHLEFTPRKRPHVHLITSSGMDVRPHSVVALPEGHVFLCDGGKSYHVLNLKGHRQVVSNYKKGEPAHITEVPSIYNSTLADNVPTGSLFFNLCDIYPHLYPYSYIPVLNIFEAKGVDKIASINWAP